MELTYNAAEALIESIVEEKGGDYIYPQDPKTHDKKSATFNSSINGCYYVHLDGTPGCIIGHLVHKLKPEFDLTTTDLDTLEDILVRADIHPEPRAMFFLMEVQRQQDKGWEWAEALRRGKQDTLVITTA